MCDHPSVYREKACVSRRPHICDECGRKIEIGEFYQNVWGVWEGRPETFHTCVQCWDVREDLRDDMLDAGVDADDVYCDLAFGQLQETLANEIREINRYSGGR